MPFKAVLSITQCPICDGIVLAPKTTAFVYQCQNGCYKIKQFPNRDDVYIFGNYYVFPAPNRMVDETDVKYKSEHKTYSDMINFWRENDRYLMRIMGESYENRRST